MNISHNYFSLQDYRILFSKLNVNTTKKRGNAPYQPLLLLSVIDLIAEGEIQDRKIYITNKLSDRFEHYRNLLSSNTFKGNFVLPFFHLKNSGFWKLKFSDAYDGGRPQTIPKLKSDVDYALLDKQLFDLLQHENNRQQLVDTLLEVYFTSSDRNINEIVRINSNFSECEIENLKIKKQLIGKKNKTYLTTSIVRNALFRKSIVHLYQYRCALCRMRVKSAIGQNIVDGAHIKPLSIFHDNNIGNGISFCKNHHWAFDNGIFTIDRNYKIIVAKNFTEDSPNTKSIREFDREKLLLPTSTNYHPLPDALQWHHDHVFKA